MPTTQSVFHSPQLYSMNLVEKAKELRQEQKKSDAILFQMLPTSVAIRLKQTGKVIFFVFSNCVRICPSVQGSGRVLRLRHGLFLWHRGIHGNCCNLFATRSLLLPEFDLQSFRRTNRVLWCLQSRDLRRRLHVSIFNHLWDWHIDSKNFVTGLPAGFRSEATSRSTSRRLQQWRSICCTLPATSKSRTQRTTKCKFGLESTPDLAALVRRQFHYCGWNKTFN